MHAVLKSKSQPKASFVLATWKNTEPRSVLNQSHSWAEVQKKKKEEKTNPKTTLMQEFLKPDEVDSLNLKLMAELLVIQRLDTEYIYLMSCLSGECY